MIETNSYKKYCPNVFVAKCPKEHSKGEVIIMTTKYGKEHEVNVHNFLGKTADGFYLYSITRVDGFNAQERAKKKAERLSGYASNAEKRSNQYYEKSNEHSDFLSLGEPIKVGHHSEKRHRRIIQKSWDNMGKSVAESEKAEEYQRRAEYWESKAKDINLSMPESLEYFEFRLEEAKNNHQHLKDNPEARSHSYSLTYAKKEVNEVEKKLNLAVKLWGSEEQAAQIDREKREEAEAKAAKNKAVTDKIDQHGGFFAFNTEQFKEGYAKAIQGGFLDDGEKVSHVGAGLYIPSKTVKDYLRK